MIRWLSVAVTVSATLALSGTAAAATYEVGANGNPFTGGLSFTPERTEAKVGDTVRWTNTDFLVPHTATENNGLWNLTGSYGSTPVNPPGFAPGESRERVFEAATFSYFCEVHPVEMVGTVAVRPKVSRVRSADRPRLRVAWAEDAPADGQAYDVQRHRRGDWRTVRNGTLKPAGTFSGRHGEFRARLRLADDRSVASGWSPRASR